MTKQIACCLWLLSGMFVSAVAAEMTIVENGANPVPIVISSDASPENALAANCLAEYVEKISGTRISVITNAPDQIPASAIWVRHQPQLVKLFPKVNFDFPHPEEILIACNGKHLVIAGRDKMVGTNPVEYGTANAVYTFLQKYLDVRWLWPGPLQVAAAGSFDLNGLKQTVASLRGEGMILLNGGTLTIANPKAAAFKGSIKGPGRLIECDTEKTLDKSVMYDNIQPGK